jgi:hypothetical protein
MFDLDVIVDAHTAYIEPSKYMFVTLPILY